MDPPKPMRPKTKKSDASSQSPVPIKISKPVPMTPAPMNSARKRFLLRMTSDIVPRIGDRIARTKSEKLMVSDQ